MFDWNNDGKHDFLDNAFMFDVIENCEKQNNNSSNKNASPPSSGTGISAFIIICVIYILIRIIF